MRLFEAILDANHRAAAGDPNAALRLREFGDNLPIVALTCIDPRLNRLLPEVMGIPEEQFIWLRNAGNIITSPLSSTMRSLALACAVKGGKEIAIIGHTDCQVSRTTAFNVIERLRDAGVSRQALPENINEFFGMFGSERANVLKGVGFVRSSPLIGSKVPVHGLIVDIDSGRLEWLVNGYETLGQNLQNWAGQIGESLGHHASDMLKNLPSFDIGEMKFPDIKIGDIAARIDDVNVFRPDPAPAPQAAPGAVPPPVPAPPPPPPPRQPLPLPAKPKLSFKRAPKP